MKLNKSALISCLSFLFFVAACSPPVYHQSIQNTDESIRHMESEKAKMAEKTKPLPAVTVNQGLYVDKTPISLAKQPAWLKNHIVLRGEQLPFTYYTKVITDGAGKNVLVRYQPGLKDVSKLSMNYSGTVKGALDILSSKTGFEYAIQGNDLYWQSIITRTFDVAFMPGASSYLMGKTNSSSSGASSSSSSTGSSVTAIIDDSAASQYSALSANISVWDDLKNSIDQMLSSEGKSIVSQSTTSVTVRDKPANVALVGKYIQSLNKTLSKQVLVKVEILTVTLENNFNFGIDWNIVQRAISNGTYQLISNNGAPISISSIIGLSNSSTSVGINSDSLLSSGANVPGMTGVISLISALEQQGKVSIVTQPQVLCQNNQVSAIRILDQQGYLASVQTTSLAGSSTTGGSSVTSQITPGAVLTGLTLYVLPKIMGDKVYMQVNADISQNLGIQNIASNGASASSLSPTSTVSIIQVPHITQKQFNQRSVVRSGDTLILSGFRQISNTAGASQLLSSDALGGRTAQQSNTETIVLITPIILPRIS